MNESNECLGCGCYGEDFGCTMPSVDKLYACPLFADEDELKEVLNEYLQEIDRTDGERRTE